MIRRNHRTPGLSSPKTGARQRADSRAQLPRVPKEGGADIVHLERKETETGTSGSVVPEIGRFGTFGGSFHPVTRLVASRSTPRRTTAGSLMVVLRVQPRGCRGS